MATILGSYTVAIHSGPNGNTAVGNGVRAEISVRNDAATPILVLQLRFYDAGVTPPADSTNAQGVHIGNLPWAAFSAVVDLLRNEGPLLTSRASTTASISTQSSEAVGEGEV